MNSYEFIQKWEHRPDADGTKAVGIDVKWRRIGKGAKVKSYKGRKAWIKLQDFYTPIWGKYERTKLKEWLDPTRQGYEEFISEEKNKINLYEVNGLVYPDFCAFADSTGMIGVLGDGSHRFIDINYLIMNDRFSNSEIEKCALDVLCAPNLVDILTHQDLPPELNDKI